MSLKTMRIALTAEKDVEVDLDELEEIAAAVQTQVERDLWPIWGVRAVVQAVRAGTVTAPDIARCVVMNELPEQGALGYHLTEHNQPEALVLMQDQDNLSVTVSHEVLEMLVDPSGNFLVPGVDPGNGRDPVSVLVEVADPPEAFGYHIDGVMVSDFVFPRYYGDTQPWGPAVHNPVGRQLTWLDHRRHRHGRDARVQHALGLAPGGYLSYVQEDGTWYQATWFGGDAPTINELGRYDVEQQQLWRSLRAFVDVKTNPNNLGELTEVEDVDA